MTRYAILLLPSANLVYGKAAAALATAELQVLNTAVLNGHLRDVALAEIGGVPYLEFSAADLEPRDVALLSNLSGVYALFERRIDTLAPVILRPRAFLPSDLLTIQKYPGKTNGQWTRLLLNVALFSTGFADRMPDRVMSVLDPLCGRGTTLNQALVYGYHAAGIELDGKDFEAYTNFLATWAKDSRLKHRIETARPQVGRRMLAEIGTSKETYKAGQALRVEVVNADTLTAATQFRPESFDVVVADLPYGVMHGSQGSKGDLSRRPGELLAAALPGWIKLLRPGGAVGLSWNTHVIGRDKLRAIVAEAGLSLSIDGPYGDFRHEVDQSITRDLVVGVKA